MRGNAPAAHFSAPHRGKDAEGLFNPKFVSWRKRGGDLRIQWEPPTRYGVTGLRGEPGEGEGEHHPLPPGASKLRAKLRTKKKKAEEGGGGEGVGGGDGREGAGRPPPLPPAGRQRRSRPGSSSRGCPVV